jgi:hypothetical protein
MLRHVRRYDTLGHVWSLKVRFCMLSFRPIQATLGMILTGQVNLGDVMLG